MKSLEEGMRRILKLVVSRNPTAWQWGEVIPLAFRHPLGRAFPLLSRLLDEGPFPQAGTATTVKQTTPSVGPSMRMVIDLANFDNSVQNITLGESGQVFSPHYRDQLDAWRAGRSFPLLFGDPAMEKGIRHRLVLKPAKGLQEIALLPKKYTGRSFTGLLFAPSRSGMNVP